MKIIKVENLNKWRDKIDKFVSFNKYNYQNFYEWMNKVYRNLEIDRFILIAIDDSDNILGISILKRFKTDNEICTFYVDEGFRGMGIGTKLMKRSLDLLCDRNPLITVPDSDRYKLYSFIKFLMKFDFRLRDIEVLDNEDRCELIFNKSINKNILLSIKPLYSNKIFDGSKRVEFRKKPIPEGKNIVVYSSSPVMSISGIFSIKGIDCDTPENLWRKYRNVGGIHEKDFFDYYSGKDKGYAIIVDKVYPLKCESILYGIGIRNLMRNFTAPQFYKYL